MTFDTTFPSGLAFYAFITEGGDAAAITSEGTATSDSITLSGPLEYLDELHVDPSTGVTSLIARWGYGFHHFVPGLSDESIFAGDRFAGTGQCLVPNEIMASTFEQGAPDIIENGVTTTHGEFAITTLVHWLEATTGTWRQLESGGQVEQGTLLRLHYWVLDGTGSVSVLIDSMSMEFSDSDNTAIELVRDGQGVIETFLTQSIENGHGPGANSSIATLLVAGSTSGAPAEITTMLTVTTDQVDWASSRWARSIVAGGRRLQSDPSETVVETSFPFTVGGPTPAVEPTPAPSPAPSPTPAPPSPLA